MNALARWPFHPLLFAAVPVLSLLLDNFDQVAWSVAAVALGIALVLGAVVWAVARLALMRERHRAALLASPLVVSLLAVSRAPLLVEAWLPFGDGTTFGLVVALWGLALGGAFLALKRTGRDLRLVTGAANFAGLAVVGLLCVRLAGAQLSAGQAAPTLAPNGGAAPGTDDAARPSVYVIVPDAHGRHDLLASNYGVDSTAFLAGLKERGFRVVEGSRSNYDRTTRSIPSMLGLDYLPPRYVPSVHRDPVLPASARFLKDRGYTFVGLQTVPDVDLRSADVLVRRPVWWGDFERELFGAFLSWERTFEQQERERVLFGFEGIERVAGARARQFVVAHVMAPHAPYVFLRDGSEVPAREHPPRAEAVRGYAEQVRYVDGKLLETIDVILARERVSPVIVLASDHGPWEFYGGDSTHGLRGSFLADHFANLVAVRLPGAAPECLWDGMTLVNVLRAVLDCGFGAHLGRLPDRSFATSDDSPAVDVTDQIGTPEDWQRYARLRETEGYPER